MAASPCSRPRNHAATYGSRPRLTSELTRPGGTAAVGFPRLAEIGTTPPVFFGEAIFGGGIFVELEPPCVFVSPK